MRLTPRQRAFTTPAPAGWLPAIAEPVYLPRDGGLGNLVARGEVLFTVPPGWARVAVRYGKHRLVRVYRVRELRPLPAPVSGPVA